MASSTPRNGKSGVFEPMDKLPSNTLKRHPKMDLNKNDLLRLLSYLEGELQGRDITIAALKAEKAKQLLYQAKYGRFGLGDPFLALQRDSDSQKDNSFDEAAVKAMYDNQLAQLENLIETQRKAQHRMREQLAAVEKRYHKSCAELDDERRKHAQDTAQGDDVTYMLEKERERLKQEVDFEKGQVKKLEKEVKKSTTALEEERAASEKHKQVAIMLIKERKKVLEHLLQLQQRNTQVESVLKDEKGRMKDFAEGLAEESRKSLQMEATMEKQLLEFDLEREKMKADLSKEETKNEELNKEVNHLRQQIDQIQKQFGIEKRGDGPQSIEIKSTAVSGRSPVRELGVANQIDQGAATSQGIGSKIAPPGQQLSRQHKNTPPNTPPEMRKAPVAQNILRDSPERDYMRGVGPTGPVPVQDPSVTRALLQMASKVPNMPNRTLNEKPVPAEKPAELSASRGSIGGSSSSSSNAQVYTVPSTGTTVFTTPSGTRISLNVGPSPNQPRKVLPTGRGVPPPVPPNKPQVYIPPSPTPRKETPGRPGGVPFPISVAPPSGGGPPGGRPQPPAKIITISKDKIMVSHPDSPSENMRPLTASNQRQPSGAASSSGDSAPVRKPSQLMYSNLDCSPITSPNSEYFGPEMADLQQLLVSVVTGSSESGTSSIVDSSPTSPPYPLSCPEPTLSVPDALAYPLHKHAVAGDLPALRGTLANQDARLLVNQPMRDGTTALHCAAEAGYDDCLQLLLDQGADPNSRRQDEITPLHLAAGEGQTTCVKMLLDYGANIEMADHSGWTALHWASTNGYIQCCRILLEHSAKIDAVTNTNWTPLHSAIHAGHSQCLELLLTLPDRPTNQGTGAAETSQSQQGLPNDIIRMTDNDGWTLMHLAAAKESKECLEVLQQHCDLDLTLKDKWNRTVVEAASESCKEFLESMANGRSEKTCTVYVEIPGPQASQPVEAQYAISVLKVKEDATWSQLEEDLSNIWAAHLDEVITGLRTKKTTKFDVESPDSPTAFTLGLSQNSVKHYSMGFYSWSPGTPSERRPFDILSNSSTHQIGIRLFGLEDGCQDGFAYQSLIPVPLLQNYMRLLEQYRNLILFGPGGTGKTFLARKLALCLQSKEMQSGNVCSIHFITLTPNYSRTDLNVMLVNKGCLLPAKSSPPLHHSPVLVFDDLSKIAVSEVFKDILPIMEARGPSHTTLVQLDEQRPPDYYYLHTDCYILGTMDRSRGTGLALSIQQRLRWAHFRNDQEPMKYLLHRQLYRQLLHSHGGRLPGGEAPVYRAVEWIVCVWQRLNDGLAKLGLQGMVFGPSHFLSCPVEANKPKAILRWLSFLWNHVIAPVVSEAVIKGSGTETGTEGQQKVAKTALYVLMQRALVSGCPLSGQEKERYLASFHGSNELDIKMRQSDKRDSRSSHNISSDEDRSPEDGSISSRRQMTAPSRERQTRRSRLSSPSEALSETNQESPDQKTFGNTIFALSGIPNSVGLNDQEMTLIQNQQHVSRAMPVSVTQETVSLEHDTSRLRQRTPLRAAVRPYNPQPGPRSLVPIHDPRRALSPGPELHRPEQLKAEYKRRAISPGPGQGLSSIGDPTQALRGKLSEANQQKRREFFRELAVPTVINPTKLQKFSNGNSSKPGMQA